MKVCIEDDFSLEKIVFSGQCFRAGQLENGWTRFITGRSVVYLRPAGGKRYEASCTPAEWDSVWRRYFDLDTSYAAERAKITHPFFRTAAEAGAGIRLLRQDPWETLLSFIISQRKSIPAIQQCIALLAERFGDVIETPFETLHAFPVPQAMAGVSCAELSACKLGYRAPYMLDAIQKIHDGTISLAAMNDLDDQALLDTLTTIRGVGVKVSSCVALFAFGRKRIAPLDVWMNRVIRQEFAGENPFPASGDAAGVLQQYTFYYALTHKDQYQDP